MNFPCWISNGVDRYKDGYMYHKCADMLECMIVELCSYNHQFTIGELYDCLTYLNFSNSDIKKHFGKKIANNLDKKSELISMEDTLKIKKLVLTNYYPTITDVDISNLTFRKKPDRWIFKIVDGKWQLDPISFNHNVLTEADLEFYEDINKGRDEGALGTFVIMTIIFIAIVYFVNK